MPVNEDRIHKPIRKLRNLLKKLPRKPSSKKIHDLRTNARRFQTNLHAFGLDDRRNERRLLRKLARVRKRAGKVRDMDVLIGFALGIEVEGEQDCIVQVLERLAQSRRKQAGKLHSLNSAIGRRLRRRLKRSGARLDKTLKDPKTDTSDSKPEGPSEAVARGIALSQDLRQPVRLNKDNLHPYRLKVKELQYTLQLAQKAEQRKFVTALGEVKDAIGDWHDWTELLTIADRELDHGAKCKLLAKLREISETKYQQAISLANHMRHSFLASKTSGHSGSRRGNLRVIKPTVLAATTAISA